jgi:hypothetical protein
VRTHAKRLAISQHVFVLTTPAIASQHNLITADLLLSAYLIKFRPHCSEIYFSQLSFWSSNDLIFIQITIMLKTVVYPHNVSVFGAISRIQQHSKRLIKNSHVLAFVDSNIGVDRTTRNTC